MTGIITSIAESTSEKMRTAALTALAQDSDWVELRLDALDDPQADIDALAKSLPAGRWIATLRTQKEGGQSTLSAQARQALLDRCAQLGAGWIDWEHSSSPTASHQPPDIPAGLRTELILSAHWFDGTQRDWRRIADEMSATAPRAVVKLAWMTEDISENLTALEICRAAPGRRMAICMGEKGVMSRVLAPKCQAFGTFCAPDSGSATARGQVTLSVMRDTYCAGDQTPDTQFFGVIGSPVAHSLSPLLFNAQFRRDAVDAVYLPLRVDSPQELRRFLDQCQRADWLNASGFSVTIPHKRTALEWADRSDSLAQRIGAANTLSFDAGKSCAHNTDYRGLLNAVLAGLGVSETELSRMRIAILGAGGAARSAVAGFTDLGCTVCIYNRTPQRAETLARQFDCTSAPWGERLHVDADLIVNCTSVGLWPKVDDTPMPTESIPPAAAVMDTVYKPIQTRLILDAKSKGCVTIDGTEMFVRQAAEQYRIWTGREMNLDQARLLVRTALTETGSEDGR